MKHFIQTRHGDNHKIKVVYSRLLLQGYGKLRLLASVHQFVLFDSGGLPGAWYYIQSPTGVTYLPPTYLFIT